MDDPNQEISYLTEKAHNDLDKFHDMRENSTTKASYLLGFLGVIFGLYANILVNIDLSQFYNSNEIYSVFLAYFIYTLALIITGSFIFSILLILKLFFPQLKYNGVETLNIYEDYKTEKRSLDEIKEGCLKNVLVGLELEMLIKLIRNRDFKFSLLYTIYGITISMILFISYLSITTFPLSSTYIQTLAFLCITIGFSIITVKISWTGKKKSSKKIKSQAKKVLRINKAYDGQLDQKTIDKIKKIYKG